MKKLILSLFAVALIIVGCDKGTVSESPKSSNPLFEYVPHDTPWLGANLEKVPEAVMKAREGSLQPIFVQLQEQLEAIKSSINHEDPANKLFLAILNELDENMYREGLENKGLSLNPWFVTYNMGRNPVLRYELHNANAFQETVNRILTEAKVVNQVQSYGEQTYWRWPLSEGADICIAILDNHLMVAMIPSSTEEELTLIPALLGQTLPENPLDASDVLVEINNKHGYTNYGTFYLNTDSFVKALELFHITPDCADDWNRIFNSIPRITAGTTELTPIINSSKVNIELAPETAQALQQIITSMPAVESDPNILLSMVGGVNLDGLKQFVEIQAEAILDNPFTCAELEPINEWAKEAKTTTENPMLPLLNSFSAFRMQILDMEIEEGHLKSATGFLGLQTSTPEMLLLPLQMSVPAFANLEIQRNEDPVHLPKSVTNGINAYLALTDQAIGVSVGDGREKHLQGWLNASTSDGSFIFSVNYDTVRLMELTNPPSEQVEPYITMMKTMKEKLGRTAYEISINENSIVLKGTSTFKD